MEVTWEVEDGFAGKSRPQTTEVPDAEIAECETVDEAMDLIEEYCRDDFQNRVAHSLCNFDSVKSELASSFVGSNR